MVSSPAAGPASPIEADSWEPRHAGAAAADVGEVDGDALGEGDAEAGGDDGDRVGVGPPGVTGVSSTDRWTAQVPPAMTATAAAAASATHPRGLVRRRTPSPPGPGPAAAPASAARTC